MQARREWYSIRNKREEPTTKKYCFLSDNGEINGEIKTVTGKQKLRELSNIRSATSLGGKEKAITRNKKIMNGKAYW